MAEKRGPGRPRRWGHRSGPRRRSGPAHRGFMGVWPPGHALV